MTATEQFEAIANRYPELKPKITTFLSGAVMLDLVINGVGYCAEFLPSFNAFGLTKVEDSSPFWEGVEESFPSSDALEKRIVELINSGNHSQ